VDLVFLDANVLFSAAYRPHSGLRRLWKLKEVHLLSSAYALEQARRNLSEQIQGSRLVELERTLEIVAELPEAEYERLGLLESGLPPKDLPILGSAIGAQATDLLTGDVTHFGPLFGPTIGLVRIRTPAEYLQGRLGGAPGPH